MLKNYILIACRNIKKYKTYSLINIFGLAIGMASCILILLYVQDELSYDTYHKDADRIYRVTREWRNENGESSLHLGEVAPPIAPLLKADYPEVLQAVRMNSTGGLVSYGDKHFDENNFYFADPEIFELFSLPFIAGDPTTALKEAGNIVITDEMSQKYFGSKEPIGKVIQFRRQFPLKVAGVIKKMPRNSHFHADFIGSMLALTNAFGDMEFQNWGSNNYATYLLLPENYPATELLAKFPDFLDRHLTARSIQRTGQPPAQKPSERNFLHLQKLTDIHLHSHLDSELEANGNIVYVYIFSAVAFFLLLIAFINFMNLATARSANRSKEVGLRKVVGADRTGLIRQFISESMVMSAISLIFALGVVYLALPWFSAFVDKDLSLNLIGNLGTVAALIGIVLFVGFAAGSYPALFLSKFQPVTVLKGTTREGTGKSPFRMALVVFQFAVSIILIIGMGVVSNQLEYCRTKNLGLVKENVVVLPASRMMIQRYPDFKNQLLQHPTITSVAASKRVPSGRLLDSSGAFVVDGENQRRIDFRIANVRVDHDFIDTYGIEITAGRNFSVAFPTDSTEAFILNETASKQIGWTPEEATGKPFRYGGRDGRIVGVVKDFHYESLHQPITPIVLWIRPNNFNLISVRIAAQHPNDIAAVLDFLKAKWQEYRQDYPFEYSFLEDRYGQLYRAEHKLSEVFAIFSAIALIIACLGLFGLASYTAEQRTKEIGIRKVLGATVSGIVFMLSREFALLVGVATLFAWPAAYFAMDWWLDGFAYKTNIQLFTFILAAGLALIVSLMTVSFQAMRAALVDPAKSLRYE